MNSTILARNLLKQVTRCGRSRLRFHDLLERKRVQKVKYRICHVEDVPPGEKRTFTVKNIPLLIVRSKEGSFYALYRFCPHQRGDLSSGILGGLTQADEPGAAFEYIREGEIIRCPWHGFSFDATTGTCLTVPEKLRVRTYPLSITDQEVFLDL